MKYYVCRKIRLLVFLQEKGFNFIKTQQDRNDPSRIVWIFKDDDNLRKAIEDYYNRPYFKSGD